MGREDGRGGYFMYATEKKLVVGTTGGWDVGWDGIGRIGKSREGATWADCVSEISRKRVCGRSSVNPQPLIPGHGWDAAVAAVTNCVWVCLAVVLLELGTGTDYSRDDPGRPGLPVQNGRPSRYSPRKPDVLHITPPVIAMVALTRGASALG